MTELEFLMYLLAGIFFGLAAARIRSRVDFLALGLFCWVLVPLGNTFQNL